MEANDVPLKRTIQVTRSITLVILLLGIFTFTMPGFLDMMVYLLPWSELTNEQYVKLLVYFGPFLAVATLSLKIQSLYLSQGYAKVTNIPIRIGLGLYVWTLLVVLSDLFSAPSDGLSDSLIVIFTLPLGNSAMFVGLLLKHFEDWANRA